MSKELRPVGIKIDTNMDADDYGSRITNLIRKMDVSNKTLNLIKVAVTEEYTFEETSRACQQLSNMLRQSGVGNFIIVPLQPNYIRDITIDYVPVVNDEINS